MAQQAVGVRVLGLEKLHDKLSTDIPAETKKFFYRVRGHALKEAKARAKPHAGDLGTLASTIKGSVSVARLSARVYTPVSIAVQVEEGRKAGTAPNARALQRWMKRHGLKADFKSVRTMQRSMKAHGTKGVKFMEGAGKDTRDKLPGFIADAEGDIKRAWAA